MIVSSSAISTRTKLSLRATAAASLPRGALCASPGPVARDPSCRKDDLGAQAAVRVKVERPSQLVADEGAHDREAGAGLLAGDPRAVVGDCEHDLTVSLPQ